MADDQEVGDKIREVRSLLDLNQRSLAQALDVRQASVSAWETGATTPTKGNLRLVADLCADSRAVYRWFLGEGNRPTIRPYQKGMDQERSAAETHGFKIEGPDLSRILQDLESLVRRAETSARIASEIEEATKAFDGETKSLRLTQKVASEIHASAKSSWKCLQLTLEILREINADT